MQTVLDERYRDTCEGREAARILRNCVHCGFCTATCPTYQLLGDELDGPRGRIYLIKDMLEGQPTSHKTLTHLDRCLTCRACETTCPSGVEYGKLLDIGRHEVERQVGRRWHGRLGRWLLRRILPHERRFTALLRLGQLMRLALPQALRAKIPPRQQANWPEIDGERTMLVLRGCVQPGTAPATNAAAARVLGALGIRLVEPGGQGCCGAVSQHLAAGEEAKAFMRRNIDAWWPHIEAGAEAIVMTASGCGAMIKDYGHLLADDPLYAAKAERVAAMTRDLSEILAGEDLSRFRQRAAGTRVAWHPPCTLQHGQQVTGVVEGILERAGFILTPVADSHLCCGSAGTYSLLQADLSRQLLDNKLRSLQAGHPEAIVTANIGCQLHLAGAAQVPVRHWIELLDELLAG